LAARDTSLYGFNLPTTPNLEKLAKQSTVFQTAYANSNWTRPSVVSILTGQYPSSHKIIHAGGKRYRMSEDHPNTLPKMLHNHGYQTAAVVSNLHYAHPFSSSTKRSFDLCPKVYDNGDVGDSWSLSSQILSLENILQQLDLVVSEWIFAWTEMSSIYDKVLQPLLDLLERSSLNGGDADQTIIEAIKVVELFDNPYFLWVHLYPPHNPYVPPAPYLKRFLKEDIFTKEDEHGSLSPSMMGMYKEEQQEEVDKLRKRYDENILYADAAFGRFIEYLEQKNHLKNTVLMVSSDHGESFEDNYLGHMGDLLYQQLIRVPMLVRLPDQQSGQWIAKGHVQIADIAPTLLDIIGLPVPEKMDGISFKSALDGKPLPKMVKFSSTLLAANLFEKLTTGSVAVMEGQEKLIWNITKQEAKLYDLTADPKESHDISKQRPQRVEYFKRVIESHIIANFNTETP
jgi:arylsulfatase A-like enzyme